MSHGNATHEQGATALPGIECGRTEASTTIPLRLWLPDKNGGRTVRNPLSAGGRKSGVTVVDERESNWLC
jgi:hypothetical protein